MLVKARVAVPSINAVEAMALYDLLTRMLLAIDSANEALNG